MAPAICIVCSYQHHSLAILSLADHPSSGQHRLIPSVDSDLGETERIIKIAAALPEQPTIVLRSLAISARNLLTQIPTLFARLSVYSPLWIPECDPIDLIDGENSAYVKTADVME